MDPEASCSSCGAANPASARFCMACGTPLARNCPSCGAEAPAQARFCAECGTALKQSEAPAELTRAPAAAKPAAAQQDGRDPSPREERRTVTVLFADLSGYTSVAEQLDHETVKDLTERCLTRLAGEVE